MLIKIAGRTFLMAFFFEFTNFLQLKQSYLLKGVSNLFDLSSHLTYLEFDLSRVFFCK